MKTALTIAGFDPSSGAGITADLAVFAAHQMNGTSAITALTVQSTAGVRSVQPVDPQLLRDTLQCLQEDLPPAGVKIGMLGSAAAVQVVAEFLRSLRHREPKSTVVLDPVLRSSSGKALLEPDGVSLLEEELLPLVDWVTPNVAELALLSGADIAARGDVPGAAEQLRCRCVGGSLGVFATGGHLDPPDDFVLTAEGSQMWLPGRRISTRATHGTGCALSSAFLCGLLQPLGPMEAAREAKEYVLGAMENATETGTGPCSMNHLWRIRQG